MITRRPTDRPGIHPHAEHPPRRLVLMGAHAASSERIAAASLVAIAGVTVLWPAGFVLWRLAQGVASDPTGALHAAAPDPALLFKTLWVAALIAIAATALGWPAAWAGRTLPARAFILIVLPLLFPSYLISSAWGLLRAPDSPSGRWLIEHGLSVTANYVLAVGGLMLWASPLAAFLISAQLRRTDPEVFESLRMVPAPRWRYWLAILGVARGGILAAFGAVFLVMLGSAVPLHVAQFDTYAIKLWRALDETGYSQHWQTWVTAWPLIAVAIIAARLITTRLTAESAAGARAGHTAADRIRPSPSLIAAALVWALSTVVPVLLFILSLRSGQTLVTFWRVTWKPIVSSGTISGIVALVASGLAAAFWIGLAGGPTSRRITRAALVLFLIAGLSPGVLIGSATAHAWGSAAWLAPVADSAAVIVLGHIARFGFIAALAGLWLSRTEPQHLRDLRRLDAGDSWRGWILGAMPGQSGILIGTGLAIGLLSFHEIEATIMLQPAGSAGGGFAWRLLQELHYFRTQELAAAMIYVIGGGVLLGTGIVWLLGRRVAASPRD